MLKADAYVYFVHLSTGVGDDCVQRQLLRPGARTWQRTVKRYGPRARIDARSVYPVAAYVDTVHVTFRVA